MKPDIVFCQGPFLSVRSSTIWIKADLRRSGPLLFLLFRRKKHSSLLSYVPNFWNRSFSEGKEFFSPQSLVFFFSSSGLHPKVPNLLARHARMIILFVGLIISSIRKPHRKIVDLKRCSSSRRKCWTTVYHPTQQMPGYGSMVVPVNLVRFKPYGMVKWLKALNYRSVHARSGKMALDVLQLNLKA